LLARGSGTSEKKASDLLFVAARVANDQGRADVLWQAGATRDA